MNERPRYGRFALLGLMLLLSRRPLANADDGLRTVVAQHDGIVVRCPAAWHLVSWGTDGEAFSLKLPQEAQSPPGVVNCILSPAPENLEAIAKLQQPPAVQKSAQTRDASAPTLSYCRIADVSSEKFGGERAKQLGHRLDALWEQVDENEHRSFQRKTWLVANDTLYTFTLRSDEAHFEAYQLDFEEMLASAKFSPPEIGVRRLADGYWVHDENRVALRLSEGWQPAVCPNGKTLLFAVGKPHESWRDRLVVAGSASVELELEKLRTTLPAALMKENPRLQVTAAIVPQGTTSALELVVKSTVAENKTTTIERHFRGNQRNYQLQITCRTADFDRCAAEFRRVLDSFREVAEPPKKGLL